MEPAQGFFDLGLYHEAWAALDELPLPNAAHPLTISLRLDILLALHRLDDAVSLGTGSCRAWPQTGGFFLKTASALMGLNDHLKAKALLLAAPLSVRDNATYWYDLARCQGRNGEIERAKSSLKECFGRDKKLRSRALDEPDLEAVWASFEKI